MLIALALFNIVHPSRVMPGKESDFPSRKENVKGRMAGELPLYEYGASGPGARTDGEAERDAEDGATVSYGYVREGERWGVCGWECRIVLGEGFEDVWLSEGGDRRN